MKMKAYIIDPEKREVKTVKYDGSIDTIKSLIGAEWFDCVRVHPSGDVFYVDDMGLYREPQWFFSFWGFTHPFAGKALVLGTDSEGGSITPQHYNVHTIEDALEWIDTDEARERAEKADEQRRAYIEENKQPGVEDIFISSTEIMNGQNYDEEKEE